MKRRAVITDADLQVLHRAVPKVLRRPKETDQSGDHLAAQRRFRLRTLHRRYVKVDRSRVHYGYRVGLAEVHRRFVLEERQTRPLIHLSALLDLDDLRALRAPPARYLRRCIVSQTAYPVIVVLVVAAGVLHAPRASAQIQLVRDGLPTAEVRAPTAAGLAVYQTGVTVA